MPGSVYISSMKRFTLAVILIILFAVATLLAQTGRKKEELKRWLADAQRLYDLDEPTDKTDSTALYLFLKAANASETSGDYLTAADCYIKAGNIHQTYQRYNESNRNYHAALFINQKHLNNSRINYEAFLYLGSSCYFSNIIDSAQYYFEQASSIASNNKDEKLPEEERLYNSLGAIYFESSNYMQAKNYFQKALVVTPLGTDDVEESLVGINSNIANCLLRLKQYDSALRIYKSLHQYTMQKEIKEIINQNTAHTYFEMGHYDSALVLYKNLSLDIALNRIKALNDIGRIYMNRQQWQQSESVFDSAIAVSGYQPVHSAAVPNLHHQVCRQYRKETDF